MSFVSALADDFIALFFPELCAACGKNLYKGEQVICVSCIYRLPYTNFHKDAQNRVAKQFWGRIPLKQVSSFLYFRKGSKVQNMMHQLKYNSRPEVGRRLGELYGIELKHSGWWQQPDIIIPVPLNAARKKKRGYNQSEHIADGLSASLNVPVSSTILLRPAHTETQTRKSRFARYENMKQAFLISDPVQLVDKHILLVDDVVTTGATLEACGMELLNIKGTSVSILTIAFAD